MNLLLAGCISGTVCMAIFAFIPNLYIKIIALVLQAIFYSGIFPLSISISSHESIENSGSILGFNIAFAYSGSVMFQPLFGYVAEYIGKEYTIFLALIGAVISLILTFILFKTVRKKYDYIKIIKN